MASQGKASNPDGFVPPEVDLRPAAASIATAGPARRAVLAFVPWEVPPPWRHRRSARRVPTSEVQQRIRELGKAISPTPRNHVATRRRPWPAPARRLPRRATAASNDRRADRCRKAAGYTSDAVRTFARGSVPATRDWAAGCVSTYVSGADRRVVHFLAGRDPGQMAGMRSICATSVGRISPDRGSAH